MRKGYVLNGVYHKVDDVDLKKLVKTQQGMFKQGDFAKQRFDHAAEILQPYTVDGKPNPKFIEAHPDAAADYGFLPKTERNVPADFVGPAEGSRAWGEPVVYQQNIHKI